MRLFIPRASYILTCEIVKISEVSWKKPLYEEVIAENREEWWRVAFSSSQPSFPSLSIPLFSSKLAPSIFSRGMAVVASNDWSIEVQYSSIDVYRTPFGRHDYSVSIHHNDNGRPFPSCDSDGDMQGTLSVRIQTILSLKYGKFVFSPVPCEGHPYFNFCMILSIYAKKDNNCRDDNAIYLMIVTMETIHSMHKVGLIHRWTSTPGGIYDAPPPGFSEISSPITSTLVHLEKEREAYFYSIFRSVASTRMTMEYSCEIDTVAWGTVSQSIPFRTPRSKVQFLGTLKYASRRCQAKKEPTLRDDYESWAFMVLEVINRVVWRNRLFFSRALSSLWPVR